MLRSLPGATDDDQLIGQAIRGDRESFGRLYERHAPRVFRHVCYLTADAALAEDLTAQTFLNALQAISRYEPRGVPFAAWLLRIAANLVINYRKSKSNGHQPLSERLNSEQALAAPEAALDNVDGERVWQHVRKLSPDQRQVIVMRFLDGLSYLEIAGVMDKSVGAVRVVQFRALTNLRRMLLAADEPLRRAS